MKRMLKWIILLTVAVMALTLGLASCDFVRKVQGAELKFQKKVQEATSLSFDMYLEIEEDGEKSCIDISCYKKENEYAYTFVEPDNTTDITLVQDLDYVTQLGKRIKDKGMDFMLSIHYSDTWADPSHQDIPKSWTKNTATDALKDSVYNYTLRCLTHLKDNGATPDFVQIGNEVSYGMLWRNNNDRCYSNASNSTWKRFTDFLSAGAKAVREATPNAKIILHIERSGDPSASTSFFTKMKANNVDYDIIGLSYYPFWHKSLATLSNTLNDLATSFPDKPVQIVETAYYYKWFPTNDSDYDDTTGTHQPDRSSSSKTSATNWPSTTT